MFIEYKPGFSSEHSRATASIILIRHAHTEWNGPPRRFQGRTDVPVSMEGFMAACRLGQSLPVPDRIICSPARRCRQTVHALFGNQSIPVNEEPRLWEIDNGKFSGLLETEVTNAYPEEWCLWQKNPAQVRVGGGETLQELQKRILSAVSDVVASARSGENIIVMTHGGPIRVLRCLAERRPLDDFHKLKVANLSQHQLFFQNSSKDFDLIEKHGPFSYIGGKLELRVEDRV